MPPPTNIEWDEAGTRVYFLLDKRLLPLETWQLEHATYCLPLAKAFPPDEKTLEYDSILRAVLENTERSADVMTPGCQTPWLKRALTIAMSRAIEESRSVYCGDLWCEVLADQGECSRVLKYLGVELSP